MASPAPSYNRSEYIAGPSPSPAGGLGGALAPPVFGRSFNPFSTRGDTLSPPSTTAPPPWIFRPCDNPALVLLGYFNRKKLVVHLKDGGSSRHLGVFPYSSGPVISTCHCVIWQKYGNSRLGMKRKKKITFLYRKKIMKITQPFI